jgi:hypothetical protein
MPGSIFKGTNMKQETAQDRAEKTAREVLNKEKKHELPL